MPTHDPDFWLDGVGFDGGRSVSIAVEIKSFLNPSAITDFHAALGQFLNYRLALHMSETDRSLYLAVSEDTFNSFFQEIFIQEAVKLYQVKLVVYNSVQEVITLWKE